MKLHYHFRKWRNSLFDFLTDKLGVRLNIFQTDNFFLVCDTKDQHSACCICKGTDTLKPTFYFLFLNSLFFIVFGCFTKKICYLHVQSSFHGKWTLSQHCYCTIQNRILIVVKPYLTKRKNISAPFRTGRERISIVIISIVTLCF